MAHFLGTPVDLAPVIQTLLTILLTVLTAATPFIVQRVLSFFKLSGDEKARAALETAISNGIALAQQRVNQSRSMGSVIGPELERQQIIAGTVAYVAPKVPDAIRRLGANGHLDEVIEARVAQPKPDTTVALTSGPNNPAAAH